MFCTNCGAQNPDTVAYCQHCGRPMQIRQVHQTHPSSPPSSPAGAVIKQRKNRGYVIAAIGAVVSLYAFYALPFVSYYITIDPMTGTAYNPVDVTANGFDSFTQFSMLLTFITLILLGILIFSNNSFDMNKASSTLKRRRTIYALIGMSMLSILIYVREVISNNSSITPFDKIDRGFWLYLLGLGIVITGSIMALRTLSVSLPPQAQQEGEQPPTQLPPHSTTGR